MAVINAWCDGGSRDNIGGWGVVLEYKNNTKELYGGREDSTNNQMELEACIQALKAIKTTNIPIIMHCDSTYVVKGVNEWSKNWIKNNWRKSDKKPVLNAEIWKELLSLCDKQDDIKFVWVKGHDGDEGNELADDLATKGIEMIKGNV